MKRIFIVLPLLLIAVSFAAAQTVTPNKLERELRAVHQQINDALNRGDKAAFGRLIADDYIVSTVSGKRLSKTDVLKGVPDAKDVGNVKLTETLSDVQVRDYGDVALMSYISDGVQQTGEQKFTARMRATAVYRRRNGQWQLVAEHWTSIPETKDSPAAKVGTKLLGEYAECGKS